MPPAGEPRQQKTQDRVPAPGFASGEVRPSQSSSERGRSDCERLTGFFPTFGTGLEVVDIGETGSFKLLGG